MNDYSYNAEYVPNKKPISLEKYEVKMNNNNGILLGSSTVNNSEHYFLNYDTQYKIRMDNNTTVYSEATLYTDGIIMGKWIIPPNNSLFVKRNSPSGVDFKNIIRNKLIEVKFVPHRNHYYQSIDSPTIYFFPDFFNAVVKKIKLTIGNISWDDI